MGIRQHFITELNEAWKLWSIYFFAAIGSLPDAYNLVATMGWVDQVPHAIIWPIRILAAGGIMARLMRQRISPRDDEKPKVTVP